MRLLRVLRSLAIVVALLASSSSAHAQVTTNQRITGVPQRLVCPISTTTAGTAANTTETDLWTCTIPGGTLALDGQTIRVTVYGAFGATANTKTLKLYFGATALTSSTSTENGTNWILSFYITRTSGTAQIAMGNRTDAGTTRSVVIMTPAETLSSAVVVKFAGLNGTAAANDVVFRAAIAELVY